MPELRPSPYTLDGDEAARAMSPASDGAKKNTERRMSDVDGFVLRIGTLEKRIAELEDAVRAIKEVLIKTGPDSAVATMIIATCDSALQQLPLIG